MQPDELKACLVFDPHFERWKASLRHRNREVFLYVDVDAGADFDKGVTAACDFWRQRQDWFRKFREHASRNMLEHLNACIVAQGHPDEQFSARALWLLLRTPSEVEFRCMIDNTDSRFEMVAFHQRFYQHALSVWATHSDGFCEDDVYALF
ncbi:hypothetical protein [Neorhodopirellula pilleata]|uniref:Uncharacterized protein n=1 Tax=Neorhodopirellula pilleata TaxID=2714738 RepID=A0A5C6A1B7_9BACT|nr:hypothetical protein [Neorhodopirellula pilleata]TWT93175.1 hypothetical protein Pla100_44920 [Neorhodopirellula pilleata]